MALMERSPELIEAADEMYAVPPAEFVAARDEQVRRAREDGKPELAKALGKLRRPTQSAYLVNLLTRDERDHVEDLLALGEEFRAAYADGDGDRLRELSGRRQQLLTTLLRATHRLGDRVGVRVSTEAGRDVEATLGAALVDPDVAEEVRIGQLAAPVDYAGFGPAWPTAPAKKAAGSGGAAEKTKAKAASSGRKERGEPAGDKEDPRRAQAEKRLAAAQERLASAENDLAERETSLESATRQRDKVGDELDRLRTRINDLEDRLTALDRGVRVASKRVQRATDAVASARRGVDDAGRRLS